MALMMVVEVGGGSPKVSTTLMGARTGEDWGWLIAATKMNLANPAQPTPLNSLILGLDNPVTELLDICRRVVHPTRPVSVETNGGLDSLSSKVSVRLSFALLSPVRMVMVAENRAIITAG